MKQLNIEQGSQEWFKTRSGVATASNFKKIVTSSGAFSKTINDYALTLAGENLLETMEDGYTNEAMERGVDLENEAIQAYQEITLSKVDRLGFFLCDGYGYSPDGLIGENGLIEVKCPLFKNHTKWIIEKRVPLEYYAQVQGGLYVSGREWCDFVSYNPNFKKENQIFIKREYRDDIFINKLEIGIKKVIQLKNDYLKKVA